MESGAAGCGAVRIMAPPSIEEDANYISVDLRELDAAFRDYWTGRVGALAQDQNAHSHAVPDSHGK